MKHTKTIGVWFQKNWRDEDEYSLFAFDASSMGYIKVCDAEVTFETPDDFNPVPAQIEILEKKEAELRRQFEEHLQNIRDQISKLQCLEYSA